MGTQFVHLHVHTHYSLLDGANRIPELIAAVKKMDMAAVAITDHGNMFGVIEFYQAAKKAGVKPILGMEAYIAPGDRRSKDAKGMSDASYHLLLLAENLAGYRNLLKLSSIAYREGFYYRPRIDREVLAAHNEGLICTSTCLGAEIPQALMHNDRAAAEQVADWYLSTFGPERFFIELQDHGMPEQQRINPELIDIAQRRGVGMIVTNDVHYLTHDDVEAHDVLCCISTGKLVADEDRFKFPTDQFYLKSPEQMAALFPSHTEAVDNTRRIAERCNVDLTFNQRHTPVYRAPEEKTPEEYLRELVYAGAADRYASVPAAVGSADPTCKTDPTHETGHWALGTGHSELRTVNCELPPDVRERIEYELEVIASKGFSSYFLIVWDFVHYARSRGIPCGARGSGCSSVVSYCLGISLPDPIHYGLYFERFMDPDRDEMPDIDIDICQEGREEVIRYVREKYGHVAQIITFGTLKARAAIRDVCRVLGVPLGEADRVAKLVPEALKMTLDKALDQEPELKKLYHGEPQIRKVLDIARRIEGLARHAGVHAAGVVIAEQPLDNYVPIYRQSDNKAKAAGESEIGADITQFDGNTVEKAGLLKMDFLGLRTLTILERARQLAGPVAPVSNRCSVRPVFNRTPEDSDKPEATDHRLETGTTRHPAAADGLIDLDRIDLTDQRVYGLFARGETQGIFQFESGGMRDVLMKMKPNRIEDLIAANALYRPGPMVNIDAYIARKHGEHWKTPHKIMDEVLEETYGIIVYQEQVARLVNRLGNIERKRAFRLAKAISKKKTEMIEAERHPFINGAVHNGVKQDVAEEIFNQILPFGEYAFNKAHSTGYALIAYQTAYMKTYFPAEYMAALLTFESAAQKIEQWYEYIDECKRMGIEVRPPDVNSSDADFTVVRENVETSKRQNVETVGSAVRTTPMQAVEARKGPHSGPYNADPTCNTLGTGHRALGTEDQAPDTDPSDPPSAFLRFGLAAIKGVGDKAVAAVIAARKSRGPFRDLFDFCERVDLQAVNRGSIEALVKAGAFDTTGAMRAGLMQVLESAIQGGAGAQADQRSGQMSMFGAFEPEDEGGPKTIPAVEWSESEMLAHEKAVLGFYVTAHPLTRHVATLNRFASADCVDLASFEEGAEAVLGGMISRVRYVVTKSGRNAGSKLAIAAFEDLSGAIEAVIFSEELEKFRALVVPEKLVFVRGKVDRRREEPSLRVTDVIPLEQAAARLAAAVVIRLRGATLTRADLETLRDICAAHKGDRPLFLEIVSPQGLINTVRGNAGLSIAPDASFVEKVEAVAGPASVRIIGQPRRIPKTAAPVPAAAEEADADELESAAV